GVPVGTVGVANGGNAAILAAEILALGNKELDDRVKRLKNKAAE
ncbi:MAG: AIR carboxylase family protein, partial [Methanobacterium sp.]|nr:AIR carboxylase family protein [Methanobacterium sp.]